MQHGFKTHSPATQHSHISVCCTEIPLCRYLAPHPLFLTFPGMCGVRMSAGDGGLSWKAKISNFTEQSWEAERSLVPLNSHGKGGPLLIASALEEHCFPLGLCWWMLPSKRLWVLSTFSFVLVIHSFWYFFFFLLWSQILPLIIKQGFLLNFKKYCPQGSFKTPRKSLKEAMWIFKWVHKSLAWHLVNSG